MWYVARSHRRYAAVGARKKCLGAMHPWRPRSSLSTTSSRRPRTAGASSMLCARACASARTRAFHPVHTLTFSLAAGCRRMNISSNEGARPSSSAPSGPTAPPPAPLLLSPPLSSPLAVFALAASASFASCPLPLPLPPLPPLLPAAPAPKPALLSAPSHAPLLPSSPLPRSLRLPPPPPLPPPPLPPLPPLLPPSPRNLLSSAWQWRSWLVR